MKKGKQTQLKGEKKAHCSVISIFAKSYRKLEQTRYENNPTERCQAVTFPPNLLCDTFFFVHVAFCSNSKNIRPYSTRKRDGILNLSPI